MKIKNDNLGESIFITVWFFVLNFLFYLILLDVYTFNLSNLNVLIVFISLIILFICIDILLINEILK